MVLFSWCYTDLYHAPLQYFCPSCLKMFDSSLAVLKVLELNIVIFSKDSSQSIHLFPSFFPHKQNIKV